MVNKFGIELEVVSPVSANDVVLALNEGGVRIEREGYNHRTSRKWKIVSDASIHTSNPMDYGMELVSPILEGEEGLEQVRKVLQLLKQLEVRVNKSCGMHVHHDATDFTLQTMKNLIKIYWTAEDQIDAFMPQSRRGLNPRWISSLKQFTADKKTCWDLINKCESMRELSRVVFDGNRYYKLNIQSYFRQKSVEFRQHSGTIDEKKVINWVKLTAGIVDQAKEDVNITRHWKGLNVAKLAKDRTVTAFYKSRVLELV